MYEFTFGGMPNRLLFCWLWAPLLAGCSVAGGFIGAHRDAETTRTREVPAAQADRIPSGSVIYATPVQGERAKGIFRGVSDSAGRRFLRMDSEMGRQAIPLDSLSELAAETHGHKYLGRGLIIGAAIDVGVIGIGALVAYLVLSQFEPNY
jgi:hypothetical protein